MDGPVGISQLAPPVRPDPSRPPSEREIREDLAAAYRLIAHFGMTDLVFTHLSVRLPGDGHRFLINPYGMLFEEITASSLVAVDGDGGPTQPTSWPVNSAGFVIHSAVHRGRADAACVMHTHTLAGMAVSAQDVGLLPLSQTSIELYGLVATHEYEGVAADDNMDERDRLVRDLGDRPCMILRNHGLLTVGRTVAEAFYWMYYLDRSCQLQVMAQSTGAKLVTPPEHVLSRTAGQFSEDATKGWLPWQALRRKLDREQPEYRNCPATGGRTRRPW
jgi:ribulose-5-phosphate 4-epimerase/fuculose-1-phosphate aldolase